MDPDVHVAEHLNHAIDELHFIGKVFILLIFFLFMLLSLICTHYLDKAEHSRACCPDEHHKCIDS